MWNLKKYQSNTAIIDDDGHTLTYADLFEKIKDISSHLLPRKLCFIFCSNSLGSLLSYISSIENKTVPVLLSCDLDKDARLNLISLYKPQYIFCKSNTLLEYPSFEVETEFSDYSLLKSKIDQNYKIHSDLALLLSTSGTTGNPKLVRLSYRNLECNTDQIISYLNIDERQRAITSLPIYYTYGLSVINTHLKAGATVLLTDKSILQKEFWSFFKCYKATSFSGVPYTYMMLDRLKVYSMDLPSLQILTQAGGHLNSSLQLKFGRFCNETGRSFFIMYGQSEASARMSYLDKSLVTEKIDSIGIPIKGGQFFIVDENLNRIDKANTVGELVYQGENVCLGYATSYLDLQLGDKNKGTLYTGDFAYFDDDGFYYITGRKKRFVKVFGNRINLNDIDKIIYDNFENIEFATYGIDDQIYIFIEDKNIGKAIKAAIAQKTKINPVAFKIMSIESLPRNASGKISYSDLSKIIE